jgi:hypothetical protein
LRRVRRIALSDKGGAGSEMPWKLHYECVVSI